MTTKPIVSICCITFNHEKYIRDAIEGFLMQKTLFPFEILIHDDASTDSTSYIIREYEEKFPNIIKPIYQTENQYSKGISISATYQFPRARGKYIAMCEGDDYWTDPLKLQKQVDFLEENSEYGLVHTNYQINNVKKKTLKFNNGSFVDGQPLDDYLIGKFHIATLTTCFRKDLLNKIDFSFLEKKFRMGDYPMWIEIIRLSKIKYISEVTSTYNQLENSASRPKDDLQNILFSKNIWEVRLFFSEKYRRDKLIYKIKRHILYYDSLILLTENQYLKSLLLFFKSRIFNINSILLYMKYFIIK